jgi:hypothetical protein
MRIIAIVAAGLSLASCSSTPSMDLFKSTPTEVELQLDSVPQGADAVTSAGPGCKTPCSVKVAAVDNLSVTYTLAKHEPQTVPVQVIKKTWEAPVLDPNPVVAELTPVTPPKKSRKRTSTRRAAPKAAPAAAPAPAAPAPASSPFPPPPQSR